MSNDDRMNKLFFIRDTIPDEIKVWEGENDKSLTADMISECFGDSEYYDPDIEDCAKCILSVACERWIGVYSKSDIKITKEVVITEPEVEKLSEESLSEIKSETKAGEPRIEDDKMVEPKIVEKKRRGRPKKSEFGIGEVKNEKIKAKRISKKSKQTKKVGRPKKSEKAKEFVKEKKKKSSIDYDNLWNKVMGRLLRDDGTTLENLRGFVDGLGYSESELTQILSELKDSGKLKSKNGILHVVNDKKPDKLPKGYIKNGIMSMLTKGTTRSELKAFIEETGKGAGMLNKTLSDLRKEERLDESENGFVMLKG